jgi:hypothetical protein
MKKIFKTIAGITLAGTLVVGAGTLSACGSSDTTYNGQYNYANPYSSTSPDYGIKVRVDVQSDSKGDRIKSVEIIDSVYTEVSDSNTDYGWDNTVWYNGLDTLLNNYRGKYISDVLAQTVSVNANGVPTSLTDDEYLISGSTQGSGRLLLAVQNALADAAEKLGYTVYTGEYHYTNPYDSSEADYGIKVKVVTKKSGDSEVVQKVATIPSDYIEVSESNATWNWDNTVWTDGLSTLLAKYEGKTVAEIQAITVSVSSTGEPSNSQELGGLLTTGSTQGSGRLLLAVQAALRGETVQYTTLEGEYHYTNPYGGSDYGIKVKVKVLDGVVKSVEVVSSDYVEASESNASLNWDNSVWYNGLSSLLEKYVDKSVEELLSVYVTYDAETVGSGYSYSSVAGQPSDVSDDTYVTSGSTQGSGRLMLAVQDALKKLDGYVVTDGEYHYTSPYGGSDYGIKARVVLKDGVIKKVAVIPSDYTEVTSSWANKSVWLNGLDGLLARYEGKTVSDIYGVTVTCDTETVGSGYSYSSVAGQPSDVSDDNYVITNSTQGSGRLMLAVQDAIYKEYGTPATSATLYTDNIDLAKTTYKVDGNVVNYSITTGKNSPAGAFTINVSVGADQKITAFEVVTNGSTGDYASLMYDVSNFIGKTLAELEALNSGDTLHTGATKSNTLTISAALFALANYTAFVG